MYLLSSLALLAAIAVPTTSISVPTVVNTTTRKATAVVTHFGQKARLLAQEKKPNRKTANSYYGLETFSFRPELCPYLSLEEVFDVAAVNYYEDDWIRDEADYTIEDFMESCNVGCDAAQENIVTLCSFTDEVCDEAGEFCINDMNVTSIVPFDFHHTSGEICMTYTDVPTDMEELKDKKACLSIEMDVDMDAVFGLVLEDNAGPENVGDVMQITDCGFTLGDEVCECSVCHDGFGGNLKCPKAGIISEECTNFKDEMTETDTFDDVSIVRFVKVVPGRGGLRG